MINTMTRREMLRAGGAAVALPLLPSFANGATATPPKKLVFLNFGFGPSKEWYPETAGANFELPVAMKPLERHRDVFSVVSNLTNIASSDLGPHWGSTTFLTGANLRRTPGREFHNSISCDQIAAAHLGKDTRFPFLALTAPDPGGAGPGSSLAWDQKGNPIQGVSDHVALFSQLFSDGGMSIEQRRHLLNRKRSILDAVNTDTRHINRIVGAEDRPKLEQYFSLVRNIETQLGRKEEWLDTPKPKAPMSPMTVSPEGTAGVELMFDLMVAALQTDSTRVISYLLPSASLIKEFGEQNDGNSVGAHPMTHYGAKTTVAYQQLIWRDRKLCEFFATLLDKMKSVKEADGSTLLDNTIVVMGSGLRTGHQRQNVPILIAGGGDGVHQGQHFVYEEDKTPLGNLWLSMLKHAGCPVESFADSNGVLSEIFG